MFLEVGRRTSGVHERGFKRPTLSSLCSLPMIYVCMREREREREREGERFVCVWEREKESERGKVGDMFWRSRTWKTKSKTKVKIEIGVGVRVWRKKKTKERNEK